MPSTAPPRYLPFADWMKAAGMALIVWGHVGARMTFGLTPPFNLKQLGVAFFVFLTGFTLARERRPSVRVVFNRCFEVFAFGLLFAVAMSLVGLALWGDTNPSNYLPLALGLHLIANAFPANPTTWYIGTYLHLLLLWAFVLRGRVVSRSTLAMIVPIEIGLRAGLMLLCGLFVAYMFLANWISVLLLGLLFGQRAADGPNRGVVPAIAFVLAWPLIINTIGWHPTFPFMTAAVLSPTVSALVTSLCVTAAYLAYTLAGYALLGRLPKSAVAAFLARNTVVVFIAHMPLYYLLEHFFLRTIPSYYPRVGLEFVICYVGLSVASEALRRVARPQVLRDRVFALMPSSRNLRPAA